VADDPMTLFFCVKTGDGGIDGQFFRSTTNRLGDLNYIGAVEITTPRQSTPPS
jgi:hypothetical protein